MLWGVYGLVALLIFYILYSMFGPLLFSSSSDGESVGDLATVEEAVPEATITSEPASEPLE